jgi:hypothetical protein
MPKPQSIWIFIFCLSLARFVPAQQPPVTIENVSYCDLARQPAKYAGKLVQTKATLWVGLDWSVLGDAGCVKEALDFEFKVEDIDEWHKTQAEMASKTASGKNMERVDIEVLGKIDAQPPNSSPATKPIFSIKHVKTVTRIPKEVPWPIHSTDG